MVTKDKLWNIFLPILFELRITLYVLQAVLIILKLTNVITISWALVALPFFTLATMAIILSIVYLSVSKKEMKRIEERENEIEKPQDLT